MAVASKKSPVARATTADKTVGSKKTEPRPGKPVALGTKILPTKKWNNALMRSAKRGNVEECSEAITKGAGLGHYNSDGATALMVAIHHEHDKVACVLIDAMSLSQLCQVEKTSRKCSALDFAAAQGKASLIELLVSKGVDVEGPSQKNSKLMCTPLMAAATCGHPSAVEMLLRLGANPLALDMLGRSPLDLAVGADCDESACLLIPVSDVSQVENGHGLLVMLCHRAMFKSARMLVTPSSAIEFDAHGRCPLDLIFALGDFKGREELAGALLAHMDPWKPNGSGLAPLVSLAASCYSSDQSQDCDLARLVLTAMREYARPDYEMFAVLYAALAFSSKNSNQGMIQLLEPMVTALTDKMELSKTCKESNVNATVPSKCKMSRRAL